MDAAGVTPLARTLMREIERDGPIGVGDYMARCLLDPAHGYYTTRPPFGAEGDFITAPEISQMFGELVGLALAQVWLDQGRPRRVALAELGPGRGTLMADMLRAMDKVSGLAEALEVHLVEASPRLRAAQRATLESRTVTWHADTTGLPDLPTLLVANEFLDALPIRQFVRDGKVWRERQVGLRDGALVFGLSPPLPAAVLAHRMDDTADGDIVEVCPALPAVADAVAGRVARFGGAAIFVDYGGWRSRGDTFQALRRHAPVDTLATPGEADLTAHVDFEALSKALGQGGAAVSAMTPQGRFLSRLGIDTRAARLADGLAGAARVQHLAAHRRLTHPAEMGELYKVMACHPAGTTAPPGLDAT